MDDIKFMTLAIKEAEKAYNIDEVPVGAVIVKNGNVIAKAYNRKEKDNVSIRHAELIAIEKACLKLKSWRLDDCILYSTLEPCSMCMGAIKESRISKVVYGCSKSKNYFPGNNLEIVGGIQENICLSLLHNFFENKR